MVGKSKQEEPESAGRITCKSWESNKKKEMHASAQLAFSTLYSPGLPTGE